MRRWLVGSKKPLLRRDSHHKAAANSNKTNVILREY